MDIDNEELPDTNDKTKKIVTMAVLGFLLLIFIIVMIGKSIEEGKGNKKSRHQKAQEIYNADLAEYNKSKLEYENFRDTFIKNYSIYSLDYKEAQEIDPNLRFETFNNINRSVIQASRSNRKEHTSAGHIDFTNYQKDYSKLYRLRNNIPIKPTDPDNIPISPPPPNDGSLGVFLFVIGIIIFIFIVSSSTHERDSLEGRLLAALKKLEELSKLDPTTNIHVANDFNGTLVMGDFYIKDSLYSIKEHDKNVSGALYNIGEYLLENSKKDGIKRADVEKYVDLQKVLAIGDAERKQNVWREFLESYPNIKDDLEEYIYIDEHVRHGRHHHDSGPSCGGF